MNEFGKLCLIGLLGVIRTQAVLQVVPRKNA